MEYETTIGLEVHAQILTASKMFSACPAGYASAEANTVIDEVSLGLPGTLPVLNEAALIKAAQTGLALNCEIADYCEFSRKLYTYPDLPKAWQITMYDKPICLGGWLEVTTAAGATRRIGITRVHMEEDTGMLQHAEDGTHSLVDYNRSGVPLMEIVSEPDITTAEEARLYATKLRQILVYIGVNSGNLEAGAMRFDANVSIRPAGQKEFGTKVEIKNMNSFRNMERAITYEIERQRKVLESGGTLLQETRGWDEASGTTLSQRSKEQAHDYRYFPEPDLPPLELSRAWVDERRAELPELPDARLARFEAQYGLSGQDAALLTSERATADYYERVVAETGAANAKPAANWILGELFRLLKETGETIDQVEGRVLPAHINSLIDAVARGEIGSTVAKQVFEETYRTGQAPTQIIIAKGLRQISDVGALAEAARAAIEANPKVVADYRSGKAPAIKFLVGQVMKATKGQANPQLAEEALRKELDG
ncbi:MAG TPA: Asp-tRNA(Asn)/Glu-tRNA(Gln) amidotransferase subunit GatB [Herpetosiphonaceae bacterium]